MGRKTKTRPPALKPGELAIKGAQKFLGVGDNTFMAIRKLPKFPKSHHRGNKFRGYWKSQLRKWVEDPANAEFVKSYNVKLFDPSVVEDQPQLVFTLSDDESAHVVAELEQLMTFRRYGPTARGLLSDNRKHLLGAAKTVAKRLPRGKARAAFIGKMVEALEWANQGVRSIVYDDDPKDGAPNGG